MWSCLPQNLHIKMVSRQVCEIPSVPSLTNLSFCNFLTLMPINNENFSQIASKTCPECREPITMESIRRIYFHLSCVADSMQTYVDDLNAEIIAKANKLQLVKLQNKQIKHECTNQIREKDFEIQRLNEKVKKLKLKLKEVSGACREELQFNGFYLLLLDYCFYSLVDSLINFMFSLSPLGKAAKDDVREVSTLHTLIFVQLKFDFYQNCSTSTHTHAHIHRISLSLLNITSIHFDSSDSAFILFEFELQPLNNIQCISSDRYIANYLIKTKQ